MTFGNSNFEEFGKTLNKNEKSIFNENNSKEF